MAKSARCSKCDLNLPYDQSTCPGCKVETYINEGTDFDQDWKVMVEGIRNAWEPGKPLPNVDTGKLIKFQGHLFIADRLLRQFGYLDVGTDSVLLLGGKYYEVNGAIKNGEVPGWWICEVTSEQEFGSLLTLSNYDYETLQEKRIRQ